MQNKKRSTVSNLIYIQPNTQYEQNQIYAKIYTKFIITNLLKQTEDKTNKTNVNKEQICNRKELQFNKLTLL